MQTHVLHGANWEAVKGGKEKNEVNIRSSAAEYLAYVASVGEQEDSIEMRYEDENIWLTQKMMSVLYGGDVRTISDHIKKVYSDSVCCTSFGFITISPYGFNTHTVLFSLETSIPTLIIGNLLCCICNCFHPHLLRFIFVSDTEAYSEVPTCLTEFL